MVWACDKIGRGLLPTGRRANGRYEGEGVGFGVVTPEAGGLKGDAGV